MSCVCEGGVGCGSPSSFVVGVGRYTGPAMLGRWLLAELTVGNQHPAHQQLCCLVLLAGVPCAARQASLVDFKTPVNCTGKYCCCGS